MVETKEEFSKRLRKKYRVREGEARLVKQDVDTAKEFEKVAAQPPRGQKIRKGASYAKFLTGVAAANVAAEAKERAKREMRRRGFGFLLKLPKQPKPVRTEIEHVGSIRGRRRRASKHTTMVARHIVRKRRRKYTQRKVRHVARKRRRRRWANRRLLRWKQMYAKERAEHPWASSKMIRRLVNDHMPRHLR